MKHALLIGLGGFCGAIARHGVNLLMQKKFPDFPWATLVVNVAGCFLIGILLTLVLDKAWESKYVEPMIVTGFLGSLTTFSTFGFQTMLLIREQNYRAAAANVALNLFVGLAAVWAGVGVAKKVI